MHLGKLSVDVTPAAACVHPAMFVSFIIIAIFEIQNPCQRLIRLQDHEVK